MNMNIDTNYALKEINEHPYDRTYQHTGFTKETLSENEIAEWWSDALQYGLNLKRRVWQNNLWKHNSTKQLNRIKKFLNSLKYNNFQWNSCMRSSKCEYGYSIGKR